ncbi:MAG: DUF721 domain-containing protein [Muribaculaceae bacterium]
MKPSSPKQVGQIISEMIAATGQTDTYYAQRACYVWADVVGPSINRLTARRYVERDVMHVFITSAPLKNELLYLTDTLIAKINEAVGRNVINKIVIH